MNIEQRILEAMAETVEPYGSTSEVLAETLGIELPIVRRALMRLRDRKHIVVSVMGWMCAHYFPSQEAMDKAMPALEAFLKIKRAEALVIHHEKVRLRAAQRYANEPEYRERAIERARERHASAYKPKRKAKAGKELVAAPQRSVNRPTTGGPARLPGEPDYSKAKWTIAPPPPAILYRTNTFGG